MPFYILSIDGGGIRGIFAARLLARIQKQIGLPEFSLIAGTSTGSIITACHTLNIPFAQVVKLYQLAGPTIFKRKWFLAPRLFEKAYQSPYDILRLKAILRQTFGTIRLRELQRNLLIPTTDIKAGVAHIIRSYDKEHAALPLYEAVQASCSAPSYFDPTKLGRHLLADGGMYANNPCLLAILDALVRFKIPMPEIKLVSVGSGHFSNCYTEETKRWGLINGWKTRTLFEFVSSVQSETTYQAISELMYRKNLLRLNFNSDHMISVDDFSRMDELVGKADDVYHRRRDEIAAFFQG